MKNITLIVTLALLLCGCSKDEARTVTNTDFADPLFYIYMQNKYDTNKDYTFQPEEVMAVTSIDLSKKNNFASLKGLELFVNVEVLNLAGQRPTDKNLKLTNPKLWSLNCSDMDLRSIDITALTELTELDCSVNNYLDGLDLSKNIKLKELNCDKVSWFGGVFKQLDLSNNPELEKMVCRNTSLNLINLSNCKKLKYLDCNKSNLKTIDLGDCAILEYLNIGGNSIASIDLSMCVNLKYLDVKLWDLEPVDISNNILLEDVFIYLNNYNSLDITKNNRIKMISIDKVGFINTFTIYMKESQTKPQVIKLGGEFTYEFKYK